MKLFILLSVLVAYFYFCIEKFIVFGGRGRVKKKRKVRATLSKYIKQVYDYKKADFKDKIFYVFKIEKEFVFIYKKGKTIYYYGHDKKNYNSFKKNKKGLSVKYKKLPTNFQDRKTLTNFIILLMKQIKKKS